jgi:hypothetical protein
LESLPGNVDLLKQIECNVNVIEKRDDNIVQEFCKPCNSEKNNDANVIGYNRNNDTGMILGNYNNSNWNNN